MVCTEWNEFKQLDLTRIRESLRQPVVVDGRNIYDPEVMARLGFQYLGIRAAAMAQTESRCAMAGSEEQARS